MYVFIHSVFCLPGPWKQLMSSGDTDKLLLADGLLVLVLLVMRIQRKNWNNMKLML